MVRTHSSGLLPQIPEQLIDFCGGHRLFSLPGDRAPQQLAGPDRSGPDLHFLRAAGAELFLVINPCGQFWRVDQYSVMAQHLRQLIICENGQLIEIGEGSPGLPAKRAVQVRHANLGAFEESSNAPRFAWRTCTARLAGKPGEPSPISIN